LSRSEVGRATEAYYTGQQDETIAELRNANLNDPFVLAPLAQALEKKGENAGAQGLRPIDREGRNRPQPVALTSDRRGPARRSVPARRRRPLQPRASFSPRPGEA
jgi:hypothetical protein